ncbi:MAG: nucleotidyltransferase domain-containing protein [Armatimonadota bacterium]
MSKTDTIDIQINQETKKLERIADEVISALKTVPSVRAIALFGSLAAEKADSWSDVDMLVACDDVEASKWIAASALRDAKKVLFYRPFTTAMQPFGRYWFVGESPFHKIDISFDSVEEYEGFLQGKDRRGCEIVTREVYRRTTQYTNESNHIPPFPLTIGEYEQEVGSYIYRSLCSLKSVLRGGDDTRGFEKLLITAKEMPRDMVMAGGNIGELLHIVVEIVRSICIP